MTERPFYAGRVDTALQGYSVGRHWHHHVEVLYVEKGPVQLDLSTGTRMLQEGECVVFYPGAVHGVSVGPDTPSRHFVVGFDPELLALMPRLVFDLTFVLPYVAEGGCSQTLLAPDLGARFIQLFQDYIPKSQGFELAVCAGIFRLVHSLMSRFPSSFLPNETSHPQDERLAIRQVVVWMSRHYEQDIPATLAAARAGMSYSHFAASFKKLMHCSFKRFLLLLRIRQAERLLLEPENSIATIALQVGFPDVSYFIKQFRLVKGVTPLKYRSR